MASATGSAVTRVSSSWRALGRMQGYQVAMVLGSALAVLAGVVTYALTIARRAAVTVPSAAMIFLVVFGALGLIGYSVSKQNVRKAPRALRLVLILVDRRKPVAKARDETPLQTQALPIGVMG